MPGSAKGAGSTDQPVPALSPLPAASASAERPSLPCGPKQRRLTQAPKVLPAPFPPQALSPRHGQFAVVFSVTQEMLFSGDDPITGASCPCSHLPIHLGFRQLPSPQKGWNPRIHPSLQGCGSCTWALLKIGAVLTPRSCSTSDLRTAQPPGQSPQMPGWARHQLCIGSVFQGEEKWAYRKTAFGTHQCPAVIPTDSLARRAEL